MNRLMTWWNAPATRGSAGFVSEFIKLQREIQKRFPDAKTWRDVLGEIDKLQGRNWGGTK